MDRDLPQEVEPLELYQGDDVAQEYYIEQLTDDGEVVGPFDFTGWSVASQWRGSGTVLDLDVTATEPGVLRLVLDKAKTRAMRQAGRLDIQGTDSEGRVLTFVKCDVVVEPDVTREA